MNCLDVQERIVDLLLGEVDPQEKAIILDHLARCPLCAEDYQFLSECISVCSCPDIEEADETYWENFLISVHERIVSAKTKSPFPYRIVIPIAASAIGILGVLYFLFKFGNKEVARRVDTETQNDLYQEVYELTPEEQKEFIKMVNEKYFGE
uniref:Zf-HC2 domain-containing protein n=1 Tax=candidate division WOR-3 bacterium TaxID=2052148 RepID=A0A7C4THZ3_UNCW3